MSEKIFARVKEILQNKLTATADEITMESNFRAELGADSLDLVEIIMAVEKEFDVEIDDNEIVKIETVGDAVSILQCKIS